MHLYVLQVPGDMVAPKMSDNETTRSYVDRIDMVHRIDRDVALAALFRPRDRRRRSRAEVLRGILATSARRFAILSHRKSHAVLRFTDDSHISLLRTHMDKSVAKAYTDRHERRSDGEDTAKVEGEGCEDAGRGCYTVCTIVAPTVRNIR